MIIGKQVEYLLSNTIETNFGGGDRKPDCRLQFLSRSYKAQQLRIWTLLSRAGVMPSGVLGQSFVPLTYPKQLKNKLAHTSARALTASPKQLHTQRMSPIAQSAPATTKIDGATFPSTGGPGSQRALFYTCFPVGLL